MKRLAGPCAAVLLTVACAKTVDTFTVNRVVLARGVQVDDLGKACALGSSMAHPLSSIGSEPPHLAMIIAEVTGGLCDEMEAWEAELQAVRARRNWGTAGPERAAEVQDAQLREARLHTASAKRWMRAWEQAEARFGEIGDAQCPRLSKKEELPYLLALVAGVRALLHDKAGGSELGVPADLLGRVSRGAKCLDPDTWWQVPVSLEAAAWAVIPGSEPEGVDPWKVLWDAADKGGGSGVRVGWGLYVLLAANADRQPDLERGIAAHAASLSEIASNPEWRLLDEYALQVTRHESDLLWTAATGHRTETLGTLPGDATKAAPDLFSGEDPFSTPEPTPP